ncbi:hypothetical protein ACO22_07382 [Paracoccidioides brasiliensis]|uniref:Uncharacterized protein n=1 Tax=Paracoccidioides brasiliensis TaxID=121759 RepID=A0A1D2J585_PARBR|nr:hypothetical protein ACO22_07382 [Paracoccidioides brasiliensis]
MRLSPVPVIPNCRLQTPDVYPAQPGSPTSPSTINPHLAGSSSIPLLRVKLRHRGVSPALTLLHCATSAATCYLCCGDDKQSLRGPHLSYLQASPTQGSAQMRSFFPGEKRAPGMADQIGSQVSLEQGGNGRARFLQPA